MRIPLLYYYSFRETKLSFGYRPEDLASVETIEQKGMEEAPSPSEPSGTLPAGKGGILPEIKSARYKERQGPCRGHGEDWSYIARVLKTLVLAEPIKDYLRTHKYDPTVVKFFHLRVLLDIVRQDEERLQLGRFRSLWRSLKKEIC